MLSQRLAVVASLLIPDHGVYRARPPLQEPELAQSEERDYHRGGTLHDEPSVLDDDHGEW
jgi:hypothetical protein